jgi:metal-responsive CopG/Arc/MetJ family transcriptional regulator
MKAKISITLSETLLAEVDKLVVAPCTRSAIIEAAVQAYVAHKARCARDARELQALNAYADEFNTEMADILAYQVEDDDP